MVTALQVGPSSPSYRDAPPKFIAGARCLDFLNTVEWRGDPDRRGERLGSYDEFVVWAEAAGYLTAGEGRRLRARAARNPRHARAIVKEALRLREALARLLDPHAGRGGRSLAALNRLLQGFPFAFRLVRVDGALHRIPVGARDALRQPLDRIILEAIELVTSGRLRAVSHCGNARCGWFFLDESRNKSRRWCDMAACGNSAKVRAHRARLRAASH
jgi:predicted RNA-binding Zn ribbon-like protein